MGMASAHLAEFEAWLHAPLAPSPDPRFIVRRASPTEFDAIYDLVDDVLQARRPRATYDWWYRRNPQGMARCWVAFDRGSGTLISATVRWPWPMARDDERLPGSLGGDQVVHRAWQRQGVNAIRRLVANSDAWMQSAVRLSWPNDRSRGARRKYALHDVSGRLRRAVLWCDVGAALRHGWGAVLARGGGRAADAAVRLRAQWALRPGRGIPVQTVRRFDGTYDELSSRLRGAAQYWCPHDSSFLNWRYVDHPGREYVCFAVDGATRPQAYGVVLVAGGTAILMELVAPEAPVAIAAALMARALAIARAAGCQRVECMARPRWPHWQLARRAGFRDRPSDLVALVLGRDEPGIADLRNWSLSAGDIDAL